MSHQDVKAYVTHLSAFRVVVCRFCEACISPGDPLRHYKDNHSAKKDHSVPMKMRHKIANYMTTLDLCQPKEVNLPDKRIPELKVIKEGLKCRFPECDDCTVSEESMRKHYYVHQTFVSKSFKNWESTSLQTFFDEQHKKYDKSYISG